MRSILLLLGPHDLLLPEYHDDARRKITAEVTAWSRTEGAEVWSVSEERRSATFSVGIYAASEAARMGLATREFFAWGFTHTRYPSRAPEESSWRTRLTKEPADWRPVYAELYAYLAKEVAALPEERARVRLVTYSWTGRTEEEFLPFGNSRADGGMIEVCHDALSRLSKKV